MREKYTYLPVATSGQLSDKNIDAQEPPKGKYPCPCCGNPTYPVPPKEDIGYICHICWWENDPFIQSDNEPSDQNHGLTLKQAKENYHKHGISAPHLLKHWAKSGYDPRIKLNSKEL